MDFLNRLQGDQLAVLVTLLAGMVTVVALGLPALVLGMREQARAAERAHALKEQELVLKRELLTQGLSAEQIERVLGSTAVVAKSEPPALGKNAGPGFDKARLIQTLLEHEVTAPDIEQLLHVLAECADDELPAKVTAIESMLESEMAPADIERVIRAFHRQPKRGVAEPLPTAFRE